MRRRCLLKGTLSVLGVASVVSADTPTKSPWFTVGKLGGRSWLIDPQGHPFFSLGLNHIDPSPLRYTRNGDLWHRKYGNSMERWLRESVRPDLEDWGFNSVGWTQEVVTRGMTNHRHSRPFTWEEYQWLDLPYCHQLPFADFHQWDAEVRHANFDTPEWAEWCDYVARENCDRMKNDPKLIGYFYIDCPTWVHTRPENEWKGPLFDPARLESPDGEQALFELATKYYRTVHDAIRRYDPHHLIFGDRYEAGRSLPDAVVRAAIPYVDVLSFQHFSTPANVTSNLARWHQQTGKPVLLADHASSMRQPDGSLLHDGEAYTRMLKALRETPGCVGYHLCGAYVRNETRRRALRDAEEVPDESALMRIRAANHDCEAWVRAFRRVNP